jgi:hypothetical protein
MRASGRGTSPRPSRDSSYRLARRRSRRIGQLSLTLLSITIVVSRVLDIVTKLPGADLAIGRNATLGVSYVGQIASSVSDHAAKGKFIWRF